MMKKPDRLRIGACLILSGLVNWALPVYAIPEVVCPSVQILAAKFPCCHPSVQTRASCPGQMVCDQLVDELAQEMIRLHAVKPAGLCAATVGDDRRKAPYLVLAGE